MPPRKQKEEEHLQLPDKPADTELSADLMRHDADTPNGLRRLARDLIAHTAGGRVDPSALKEINRTLEIISMTQVSEKIQKAQEAQQDGTDIMTAIRRSKSWNKRKILDAAFVDVSVEVPALDAALPEIDDPTDEV